jgi:hypothetical protein
LLLFWVLIAGLACAVRMAAAPVATGGIGLGSAVTYAMVVAAPLASMILALRWFADGDRQPRPLSGFVLVGQWRGLAPSEARLHPLYGASGVMVSLLVGMLLNVPVRAAEFFVAVPPIPSGAPQWLSTLQTAMTLDVLLFSSLYAIAFVAALKRSPVFPGLLVAIWISDVAVQMVIGHVVASRPGLPVAVASALHGLLSGTVGKVLVSVSLWLPYLLLSTRVNVTYRHRIPA